MAFEYQNQPDLVGNYQQSQAAALANQKAKQEMQDFLAAREAMKELGGGEYLTGFEEEQAQRPNALRNLYRTGAYQQAQEIEKGIAAPFALRRAAAQAGAIEKAKRDADAAIAEQLTAKIMDRFKPVGGGGGGGGATTVGTGGPRGGGGRGIGMQPIIRTTKEGWPTVELDPFKAEEDARKADELANAQELALRNRIGSARAGAAKAQEDFHNDIISKDEMDARLNYYKADAEAAVNELSAFRGGGVQAPPPQSIPVTGATTIATQVPAAAPATVPAPAPTAPIATKPPATPGAGIPMTKGQRAEQEKIATEQRNEQTAIKAENRAEFKKMDEEFRKGGGRRQALASNALDQMQSIFNKRQLGDPLLNLEALKKYKVISDNDYANFEAATDALAQSYITQGTSGAVNTATEYGYLKGVQPGIAKTPEYNANQIAANLNGRERDKQQGRFYARASEMNFTPAQARQRWDEYLNDGPSPYVVNASKDGNKVSYQVEKNHDYKNPMTYLERTKKTEKAAPAASAGGTRTKNGRPVVEVEPGVWEYR